MVRRLPDGAAMKAQLMTETNTPTMEQRVLRTAHAKLRRRSLQADFEHGQWWVTDLDNGQQWSVVDCETHDGKAYLDFEEVTRGDSE